MGNRIPQTSLCRIKDARRVFQEREVGDKIVLIILGHGNRGGAVTYTSAVCFLLVFLDAGEGTRWSSACWATVLGWDRGANEGTAGAESDTFVVHEQ